MKNIEFSLTKTQNYNLKPFGRFKMKFCPSDRVNKRIDVISTSELSKLSVNDGMPLNDDDVDKKICKFMIKNKTDFLIDDDENIYSRFGDFCRVHHKKFDRYKNFLKDRNLEDSAEAWDEYVNGSK
jgi:hypothetical protein